MHPLHFALASPDRKVHFCKNLARLDIFRKILESEKCTGSGEISRILQN